MKKIALISTLALVGFAGVATSVNAAPIIIDNFDGTTTYNGSAELVTPVVNDAAGSSSAGYSRLVNINSTGQYTDAGINTSTNPDVYTHSQSSGVKGYSEIVYNLGGLDLDNDTNAFRVQLVNIDLNASFGVTVDGFSVALSSTNVILANSFALPSYADILFNSAGFAGVNWNTVNTVKLFVNGSNTFALDATLDNFSTVCSGAPSSGGVGIIPGSANCTTTNVPEPASLGLLGFGFAGLAGFAAARKKKQA